MQALGGDDLKHPTTGPGWRGRIGVIQPAPGLMLEHEWARAIPDGVAFPVTRLALPAPTQAGYRAMAARAPDAAAILAGAGVGAIAYACGVGSLHAGPDAERALMARLSEAAGGLPVIGMAQAAVDALRATGARRVTLLTPYAPEVNALVEAYLAACGLAVAAVGGLPAASAVAAAGLAPDAIVAAACRAVAMAATDALWIACSNVRSLDLAGEVEARTATPCVSSNRALLARMLEEVGVGAPAVTCSAGI